MNHKIFFAIIGLLLSTIISAQKGDEVLMTVSNIPVTVDEFKYIYEKNNGKDANYSKKSLDEYLELYSKFKLKVARAKDLKLDTIKSLQDELSGYKRQLANSYLTDKEILDELLKQLQERQKQDVKFKHILVSHGGEKTNDSLNAVALKKINNIKSEIDKGKSFEVAAKEYSDDKTSGGNGGDLGFWTAMMPEGFYDLENVLYTQPIGKVSNVVKSRLGYHLIKVEEKRPAKGLIGVAHILIKNNDREAKMKIDEAYNKLIAGEDFAQVCATYSDDKQTNKSGGFLPAFNINTYETAFEEAAYSLLNDGDISKPIQTKSGWHIIKRVKKMDVQQDFLAFKKLNEPKIKKDERFALAKKRLVENIKKTSGYRENMDVFNKYVATLTEDFLTFKWAPELSALIVKEPLISFGSDNQFSVSDFAVFSKKNTKSRLKYEKSPSAIKEVATLLLAEFADEKAIDVEQKLLEVKYPDFKALLREYDEGILLFEATKRAVWDKANQDSVGLASFYQSNQNNYKTDEKGNLLVYNIATTDMKFAEKVLKLAKKKSPEEVIKKLSKKDQVVTYVEETLEKSNARFKDMAWEVKKPTPIVKNEENGSLTFSMITRTFPVRNKSLKEARGYVVADYQEFLEEEWLKELSSKYAVDIKKDVLNKLIKN
jgi:peptidyl-prolyl cis-trans isomerase SurA